MTFRFDDVCINTNTTKLLDMLRVILCFEPNAEVILAFSPVVFGAETQLPEEQHERVHPSRLTALSALTPYYEGQECGLPVYLRNEVWDDHRIIFAGHGLMHVDHRLLSRDAQEMSILGSAQLARGRRKQALHFVPPYNKWNETTADICHRYFVSLARFEDGWEHVLYNDYNPARCQRYYLHPFDMNAQRLTDWFAHRRTPMTVTSAAPIRHDQLEG